MLFEVIWPSQSPVEKREGGGENIRGRQRLFVLHLVMAMDWHPVEAEQVSPSFKIMKEIAMCLFSKNTHIALKYINEGKCLVGNTKVSCSKWLKALKIDGENP